LPKARCPKEKTGRCSAIQAELLVCISNEGYAGTLAQCSVPYSVMKAKSSQELQSVPRTTRQADKHNNIHKNDIACAFVRWREHAIERFGCATMLKKHKWFR
jgi:hypothetical protein